MEMATNRELDEEKLLDNLSYFLQAVIPVAEECGIRMAIHPVHHGRFWTAANYNES